MMNASPMRRPLLSWYCLDCLVLSHLLVAAGPVKRRVRPVGRLGKKLGLDKPCVGVTRAWACERFPNESRKVIPLTQEDPGREMFTEMVGTCIPLA